jgi:hypothetical protein
LPDLPFPPDSSRLAGNGSGTFVPDRLDLVPSKRLFLFRAGFSGNAALLPPPLRGTVNETFGRGPYLATPVIRYRTCILSGHLLDSVPEPIRKSKSVTIYIVTLGSGIDTEIDALFASGEALRGSLLDAWGSESAEALAARFDKGLRRGRDDGTIRFSPGFGGVPATANARLAEAVGELPVEVDSRTGILRPRKSVLCVIGWGDDRTSG